VIEQQVDQNLTDSAERYVLGAAMVDADALPTLRIILGERDSVFFAEKHRLIYAALRRLADLNIPADIFTLTRELQTEGDLKAAGGVQYLHAILESVPSAANAAYYAEAVREASGRRGLHSLGVDVIDGVAESCPTETLVSTIQDTLAIITAPTAAEDVSIGAVMEGVYAEIDNPTAAGKLPVRPLALSSKITHLNAGDMVVVAGTTSVGKSALAMNIAWLTCVTEKKPVVYVSLEMTEAQVGQRILAMLSGVSLGRITNPDRLTDADRRQLSSVAHLVEETPFYVVYESGMGIEEVANIARMYHKKHGELGCVVVDYLQYIRADTSDSRNEEVSKYSVRMKSLAGELKTACIVVSQLNRQASNGQPELSHLRDSGSIEQDADAVMMIDRPNAEDDGAIDRESVVFVRKNRQGETGPVEMLFTPSVMRWE